MLVLVMVGVLLFNLLIIGGTFALFNYSAHNAGNTFGAGTLELDLTKEPISGSVHFDNLAPGDQQTNQFTIKNVGTLDAILHALQAELTELAYQDGKVLNTSVYEQLNEALIIVIFADDINDGEAIFEGNLKNLQEVQYFEPNFNLFVDEEMDLQLRIELDYDAGNDLQGLYGSFDLTFHAIQLRHNEDASTDPRNPGSGDPGDGEPGDGEPGDGGPGDGEPGDGGDPSDEGPTSAEIAAGITGIEAPE